MPHNRQSYRYGFLNFISNFFVGHQILDDVDETSESVWLNTSLLPDVTNETDGLNWDTDSSDGEGNLRIPLDFIPRNVKRQLKGQEFLRRLKENLGDNEHGEA